MFLVGDGDLALQPFHFILKNVKFHVLAVSESSFGKITGEE